MRPLIISVLVLCLTAPLACAQVTTFHSGPPGSGSSSGALTPPAPLGGNPGDWQQRLDMADRLLAAGYLDEAQADYESIIRDLPENSPGVDRCWLGLARVHVARGDVELAKASVEQVLRRNLDAPSVGRAKDLYRQLKTDADGRAQQAMMAVQFFEYRYYMTPWFDFLTKIFYYFDLRTARKRAEAAHAYARSFDPRYLLADLPPLASASGTMGATLSAADFAAIVAASSSGRPVPSVHTPAGGTPPVSIPLTATPAPAGVFASAASVTAPSPAASLGGSLATVPGASPASGASPLPSGTLRPGGVQDDLATRARAYQEAYRKLQDAMRSGDQQAVIQANADYHKALDAYRKAAEAAGGAQGR